LKLFQKKRKKIDEKEGNVKKKQQEQWITAKITFVNVN
jgi:hypothetical protein